MSRMTVFLACSVLAAGTALAIQRSHNLNVNDRWIMSGARCQTLDYDKAKGYFVSHEGQFGELQSFMLVKTADANNWVLKLTDYDNCTFSLWGSSGEVNKVVEVRSISSY